MSSVRRYGYSQIFHNELLRYCLGKHRSNQIIRAEICENVREGLLQIGSVTSIWKDITRILHYIAYLMELNMHWRLYVAETVTNKWCNRWEIFAKEFRESAGPASHYFCPRGPAKRDRTLLLKLQFFSLHVPAVEHAFLLHGYKFKRA